MDALTLDMAVRILSGLCMAFLVWGGWLCIGGGTAQAGDAGAAGQAQARFS